MGEKPSKSSPAPEGRPLQEGSGDVAAGTAVETQPLQTIQAPNALVTPLLSNEAEEGAQEAGMPSEGEILAKLVAHLGNCPERSMALADLRLALPPALRKLAEDTQAISTWLQRFQGLIQIVGEPGQEQVMLNLGGVPAASKPAPATPPDAIGSVTPATTTPATTVAPESIGGCTDEIGGAALQFDTIAGGGPEDESLNICTVQLRGLPFRAQVQDIKTWLGYHAVGLATKEPSIRLLLNRDGRPSGFARVVFVSPEAAREAREELHKKLMGDRYVEVLACSDRANKTRNRRTTGEGGGDMVEANDVELYGGANEAVERERVLQECRDHMRLPGRQHLLLSMLGIALSQQARAYLRRVNLGLKHFLARFPHEFRVEGPKGCEKVIWCPNGIDPYQCMPFDPAMMSEAWAAAAADWSGVLSGEVQMPHTSESAEAKMLVSPTPQRTHNPLCQNTPSNWGTPGSGPRESQEGTESSKEQSGGGTGGTANAIDPAAAAYAAAVASASYNFWAPTWGDWGMGMGDMDAGKGGSTKASGKKTAKADAPTARSHAHLHPQSHPFAHQPPGSGAPGAGGGVPPGGAVTAPGASEAEGHNGTVAALRLRGLPFSMSVQDVLAFFAQYDVADRIAEGREAAQLLPKANGRPSGQARVQMRSRQDAEVACQALNNQYIGGRYIEVFVYGDTSDPEAHASEFGQSGFPGPDLHGGDAAMPWQRQGFPGFPGMPFGPGFGAMGPPPWAVGPPPAVGAGTEGGSFADGGNLDNLFSFLHAPEMPYDSASTTGTDPKPEPSRNSVTV
jgi:hypothetical protein